MGVYLAEKRNEFHDAVEGLRESVRTLKNAELKNPNIPKKELDFMEGNRIALMKRVVVLARDMTFPEGVDGIVSFHESIQKDLDSFTSDSFRSYQDKIDHNPRVRQAE